MLIDLNEVHVCERCYEKKQLRYFATNESAANGRRKYCKSCLTKYRKQTSDTKKKNKEWFLDF